MSPSSNKSNTSSDVSYFPSAVKVLSFLPAALFVWPAESESPHSVFPANVLVTCHCDVRATRVSATLNRPIYPGTVFSLLTFHLLLKASRYGADHDELLSELLFELLDVPELLELLALLELLVTEELLECELQELLVTEDELLELTEDKLLWLMDDSLLELLEELLPELLLELLELLELLLLELLALLLLELLLELLDSSSSCLPRI